MNPGPPTTLQTEEPTEEPTCGRVEVNVRTGQYHDAEVLDPIRPKDTQKIGVVPSAERSIEMKTAVKRIWVETSVAKEL